MSHVIALYCKIAAKTREMEHIMGLVGYRGGRVGWEAPASRVFRNYEDSLPKYCMNRKSSIVSTISITSL
jgi:hypothetical protein